MWSQIICEIPRHGGGGPVEWETGGQAAEAEVAQYRHGDTAKMIGETHRETNFNLGDTAPWRPKLHRSVGLPHGADDQSEAQPGPNGIPIAQALGAFASVQPVGAVKAG